MKFILLFVLLIASICTYSQGPSGCILYPYNSNNPPYSGKVFTQNIGTVPTTTSTMSPFIALDIRGTAMYEGGISTTVLGPNVSVNISCYKEPTNQTLRECAIRFRANASTPIVYSYYGGLLAQNYYNCPLDDYILILILPLGAFGFYTMRKTNFTNLASRLALSR